MPARTLVLAIGLRAGVVRAAERLGVDLAVLDHRTPAAALAPRLAGFRRVDWSGPAAELLGAAHALAAGRRVSAVIALTEGAVLPASIVREAFGAPGSDVATATRCSDKRAMKRAVRAAGIECAPFAEVAPGDDPEALVARLGLPLVLKRPASSGSRGLVVARDLHTVRAELAGHELAEGFVEGVEMSVEGFLRDGRVLFSSTTRYVVPLHANVVPSGVDEGLARDLHGLLQRAADALGLRLGIAHMEVFLARGGVVFGELGARPPGGRLMPLIQRAWGFDPYEALLRIVLGLEVSFPARPRRAAGTWILHPGPGVVGQLAGEAEARAYPGVRRLVVRVGVGDVIRPREGSGQDVGHIDVDAPDPDAAEACLVAARDRLRFELRPRA